jgi:tetratricopeptide (TPR) repeat protein
MDPLAAFERAFALHQSGRLAQAEALYRQLLAAVPGDPATQLLLGILLGQQGRHGEALPLLDSALAADSTSDLGLLNRGNALAALGRSADALSDYDRGLALYPDHADLRNARGLLLVSLRRFQEGLSDLDAALAVNPDFAQALNNRGNALQGLKRFAEAVESYDRALTLDPRHAQGHNNRANALRRLGRLEEALSATERALALEPGNAESLNDRGNVLQDMDRLEDAIACYSRALEIRPGYLDALNNRGNAWRDSGRFDEALADFDCAIRMAPDAGQAHWSKSIVRMLTGELEEGLRLYEWRKKLPVPIEARDYPQALWTGEQDIAGKTLFLYVEQGLGDTILFYRYALMARAKGARVVLAAQDAIGPLLRDADAQIEILGSADVPAWFDYHAPLMSLPLAFGTQMKTIPAPAPYLRAREDRVAYWSTRLGKKGFKIGLLWQGATNIAGRSFPLAALAPIAELKDVRLISLQKGEGADQLGSLPSGMTVETLGEDFDAGAGAFLDSAAVMQSLDLVITPDTSLAHLAGALGRPAWVALKHIADWRWFLNRDDSPWYPSLTLFRQRSPGDWTAVFADMRARLRALHFS